MSGFILGFMTAATIAFILFVAFLDKYDITEK